MSLVSLKPLLAVIAEAATRGVSAEVLLEAARIDADALKTPDGWLPQAAEIRLWTQAAHLTQDDSFGLHVGERVGESDFGALAYAARSSDTLGDAYVRIGRFFGLIVRGASVELHQTGSDASVRHVAPETGLVPSRHAVEALLVGLVRIGQRFAKPGFAPRQVRFRHRAPSALDEHRRLLGNDIQFGAEHDEVVLTAAQLALPLHQAEPALCELLDRHLQALSERVPEQVSDPLHQVRRALGIELRHGKPTLAAIAAQLKTSPRSLQRRLQREGTTLAKLHDEVRSELASRYLNERSESISEIAFLLGFAQVSTFHRAFKRWTGETPASYRCRPSPGSPRETASRTSAR